ncbi:hypothetical protein NliqN6_1559 [Naganishia liquefaciens]|uniref:G-patch domain-containing protein n=1 Tax=Naganishia liquefaciens TaxID=104408 RepID=A0A8H3TQ40_9TREE|nr:hypothetical protein NliqN6_1559 [Naganishia liquefaciens]
MSSSEDDFMSDKYLTEAPQSRTQTYTQRRAAAARQHLDSQPKPRAVREEEARRKALETSLFAQDGLQKGAGKAMGLMMKMGWTPGEGLGKKRVGEGTDEAKTRPRESTPSDDSDAEAAASPAAPGIGVKRRKLSPSLATSRTEPLRISLWAGKSGLGAHTRSPSPENMSFLLRQAANPSSSGPGKALDDSAEAFRRRRAQVDDAKRTESREWAARALHMEFEQARGTIFHPLWIVPLSPLTTLPRPLIRLIDPELADTLPEEENDALQIRAGSPRGNMSAAERMREEMRRDALVDLVEDENEPRPEGKKPEQGKEGEPEVDVDWASFIPSVHRVLRMDAPTHLSYLIDSLRIDHLYCFWCAARYGSVEEMNAPGGCPGEDEDDH